MKDKKNVPITWSQLSYSNESHVPRGEETSSSSWKTYYFKRDKHGNFLDLDGNTIAFEIRNPDIGVEFLKDQLYEVEDTLKYLTCRERKIAKYWGTGAATKQWTPVIDILIDTYKISAPRAARILAAVQSGLNDSFVITWYFKFLFDIPRPNQLNQELNPYLNTPRHPSYPAGHAVVAGTAEVILSYFFAPEKDKLKDLAEECAKSRLYAGVHYPIDNEEGLRLGRHIGRIIVDRLKEEYDEDGTKIDYLITDYKDAKLIPPPYTQAIPFDYD